MGRKKQITITLIVSIILFAIIAIGSNVQATEVSTRVILSDNGITVDGEKLETGSLKNVHLTQNMYNGGISEDALEANIKVKNIINITSAGVYEFSGILTDGQISINSNDLKGDVEIILNNANITCEKAPAIFIYNTTANADNCKVIIKLADGSNNEITGGKIKQSVEGWEDQSEIEYYIEKGYDDDRQYYERYKYDGAISSDVSLEFEGNGTLTVNSTEEEGIESKGNITINSGNYIVNSLDDGINAYSDKESIITINGGNVLVNVQSEAEEGDGIDSNGAIYINGGEIYAFACEKSGDNGLDADTGIYINGGKVVATGNMMDEISKESKQEYIQLSFSSKVQKNSLITITDEKNNPMVAFKGDREYSILTVSVPDLKTEGYKVYEGGSINGTSKNGFYTEITSYNSGTEKEYSNSSGMRGNGKLDFGRNNVDMPATIDYIPIIVVLVILLVVAVVFALVLNKKHKNSLKISMLVIGVIIGMLISTVRICSL